MRVKETYRSGRSPDEERVLPLSAAHETHLPLFGRDERPSGIHAVTLRVGDVHGGSLAALATFSFVIPQTTPLWRIIFASERKRAWPGFISVRRAREARYEEWRARGVPWYPSSSEALDEVPLGTVEGNAPLIIEHARLAHYQAHVLISVPNALSRCTWFWLFGNAFDEWVNVEVKTFNVPVQSVLALMEQAVELNVRPDLLDRYEQELAARDETLDSPAR
jgi:hypothetical protein